MLFWENRVIVVAKMKWLKSHKKKRVEYFQKLIFLPIEKLCHTSYRWSDWNKKSSKSVFLLDLELDWVFRFRLWFLFFFDIVAEDWNMSAMHHIILGECCYYCRKMKWRKRQKEKSWELPKRQAIKEKNFPCSGVDRIKKSGKKLISIFPSLQILNLLLKSASFSNRHSNVVMKLLRKWNHKKRWVQMYHQYQYQSIFEKVDHGSPKGITEM